MRTDDRRLSTIIKEWDADLGEEAAQLEATNTDLLKALELLVYANNSKGACACGYDGKLTSDLCPIHGIGAQKANEAITKARG